MALCKRIIFCNSLLYLVNTNILKAGCRWLSKTDWTKLEAMWLCKIKNIQQQITFIGRDGIS